jgi:two-component system CheB/CheR fusion protein
MSEPDNFPIVGIGASAGGVEALEGFFRGLPNAPGVALVVVTHLSPDRESVLHEIIGRYTTCPVHVATNDMEVEINNIYVLPADAFLSIEKRRLQIRKRADRRERKPVDIFFASLANDVGELSAGIILSGGDSDGTLGVKAIKECGGLTLAQVADGFGPQHPDMPESAISTGLIDFALPVEEMGPKLVEFARSLETLDSIGATKNDVSDDSTIDQVMPEICGILRNQIGHDFSGYKTKTFMRRVQRRIYMSQLKTMDAYLERLRQEPQEVSALFRDLLINVTNFFRDAEAFDGLAKLVVPKLFEGRGADETIRIWVPGCATGEEVFSIGILLREHMDTLTAIPRVQIFATDIDERALAVARAARYPLGLLDSVSEQRRKRFFLSDGGSAVVSKDVRDLCVFSPHSVLRDPPFSRIDLVSCRNLLIYFGADAQNQVIPTFHYALRPQGYLFLGSAENVSQFDDLFNPLDKKHRIFRRRNDVAPRVRLPIIVNTLRPGQVGELAPRRASLTGIALRQVVDEQVLEHFSPPHVVVNRDGDVLYYSSKTGKYLEPPPGAPTRQLLTMARKGLRLDLRSIFREAVETGQTVVRGGVTIESDGGVQIVTLTVEPLSDRGHGDPLYLVLFADQGPVLSPEEALTRVHASHDGTVYQIERELRETRDRLQSMVEEYETALEELKSSNEELVSVNEEMQSTNEELEASKEELQSVNEELHTVNAELNGKVDALDRAHADLQNLFESTNVATVFLDKKLVIRSFTPAVTHIFNILQSDRGRPITDLSTRLKMSGFIEDIASVFAGDGAIERRVESEDYTQNYLVRLAPYLDNDQKIEGVVVTFIDVTSLTRAERRQDVLIEELQHRTRNLLAVVQSIARQTLEKGKALNAFSTRLSALGRVQSLISVATDDQIDVGDIVRLELQAIGAPAEGRVKVTGPKVSLGFALTQTFGLALHELATNAVKHGALKDNLGQIEVIWSVRPDNESGPILIMDWLESGVEIKEQPSRKGFGRSLIERALGFTLRAKTELMFGANGVSCHIEVPLLPKSSEKPTFLT